MRNRAKCKLCGSVIESYHSTDLVLCKCGEISVDGGDSLRCAANDWDNFLRVDDEGNEIIVSVINESLSDEQSREELSRRPTKKELISMLDDMVANIERLPAHAKMGFVTNYDLAAALMLIGQIFKTKK